MKCINFDQQFEQYMGQWIAQHADQYDHQMDVIEGMMPDIYMAFLGRPADFLDGMAPQDYFEQYTDAQMLTDWMCEYMQRKIPVPDLLMERISALGDPAPLLALIDHDQREIAMTAISLLQEMECSAPMQLYIDLIAAQREPDEKADRCAEALLSMGDIVVEPILQVLPGANETGRDIFADILSNYPGDERIYALLLERFTHSEERRALFASYLAKLGDERAVPVLLQAAQEPDIHYLDYVEIASAMETLGAERPPEREFSGDPDYEALRGL